MTETPLTIINRALQQMGARSSITSLDEDSNEARAAKLIFDRAVRTVLAEDNWNFTRVFGPGLPISATNIPFPWTYAFAFPAGALSVRAVTDAGAPVPLFATAPKYAMGLATLPDNSKARCLYTNIEKPFVTYTALVTDFDSWEVRALDVLELYIAAKLAIPLSGDKTLMQGLWQQYQQALAEAKLLDANEDVSQQNFPPDWLLARDYYFGIGIVPLPGGGGSSAGGGGGGATYPYLSGSDYFFSGDDTLLSGSDDGNV